MPRLPSRRRTTALGLGVLALGGGAVVLPLGAEAAPRSAQVLLEDYRFQSPRVTIARGGSVTWRWRDNAKHNVTAAGRRFRSSSTKATGTHRVVFRKPGTYRYSCTLHAGMTGVVVVR